MSRASELADRAEQNVEEVVPHIDELLELMVNTPSEAPDASYALGRIAEKAPLFFVHQNRLKQINQGVNHDSPTIRQNAIGILNEISRIQPKTVSEAIPPETLQARLSESNLEDPEIRAEIRKNSTQLAFKISRVNPEIVVPSLSQLISLTKCSDPIDTYAAVTVAEISKDYPKKIAPKLPEVNDRISEKRPEVSEFLIEIIGRCASERPDLAEVFQDAFKELIKTNNDSLVINGLGTMAAFATVNPKAVAPLIDEIISLFEDTYSTNYPPMAKRNAAETLVVLSRKITNDEIRLEQRIRELQETTTDRTTARLLELSLTRINDQTRNESPEAVFEDLAESLIEGGPLVFAENVETLIRDSEIHDSNVGNETPRYDRL